MHSQWNSSDPLSEALPHLEQAYAFKARNELGKALAEVRHTNRIAPGWADAHYLRGLILEGLGRGPEATKAFEIAARLDPSLSHLPPTPSRSPAWAEEPAKAEPAARTDWIAPSAQEDPGAIRRAATGEGIPHAVPWTGRDTWLALLTAIIIWISIPLGLWALLGTLSLGRGTFLSVMTAASPVLWIVSIWWFGFRKYGIGWGDLGFRRFRWVAFGVAFALLFAAYFFADLYGALLQYFNVRMAPDVEPIVEHISAPWLILVGIIISAPIMEEIFFRGFVFAGFRQRYGWQKGALISSFIFAALHFEPLAFPFLFLLGYVLAYLYHRTNSIWPCIFLHFFHNGLVVGIAMLAAASD